MKRMNLSCSSPSSTATLNHRRILRHAHRSTFDHRDHNPLLHDRRWKPHLLDIIPCSSGELPFNPKAGYHYENNMTRKKKKIHSASQNDLRRKSSTDASDLNSPFGSSKSCLLGTRHSFSDCSPERKAVSQSKQLVSSKDDFGALKSTSSPVLGRSTDESLVLKSAGSTGGNDQEVVLYVSLHCKGCEEKVRKHISKMEGVRSFCIDLATKKVTIIGNLSPLSVVTSVSKVKRAHLWPSSTFPPPLSRR